MKASLRWSIVGGLVILGAAVGVSADRWLSGRWSASEESRAAAHSGDPNESDDVGDNGAPEEGAKAQSVATVRVATAQRGQIIRTINAIGSAVFAPDAANAVIWPAELAIKKIMVLSGQRVESGAPLLEVSLSPEAQLQLTLATQAVDSASAALDVVKARVERALATRYDAINAQGLLDDSKQKLARLRGAVPPSDSIIRASSDGFIQNIRAEAGAVSAGNTMLLEIVQPSRVVAQMGVEPALAKELTPGLAITINALEEHNQTLFHGVVLLVAPALNPLTRLIDLTAEISGEKPPPGLQLRGEIQLAAIEGVMVPREAIVADGDDEVVFVVHDGVVKRVVVEIGSRMRDRFEVVKGLVGAEQVVVLGQSQLEDGAHVRLEGVNAER